MGSIEREVRVLGHTFRVEGDETDGYVQQLPSEIFEPALEYAQTFLPSDGVVLDIGANIGLLSLGFASLVPYGRVIAFEPSPTSLAHLRRAVQLADEASVPGAKNIEIMPLAVSDATGDLLFFDSPWFSAGSFIKEATLAATVHDGSVLVPARRLDDVVPELDLSRLDLIKVDVEGHELQVLRGATETLARFRPAVVIEMNLFTTTSFGNVLPLDFLSEICAAFPWVYDYRLGEGIFPMANPADMYGRVQAQFVCGRPSDLICRFTPLSVEDEAYLAAAAAARAEPDYRALSRAREREAAQYITELEATLAEQADRHPAELLALEQELASLREAFELLQADSRALRASTSWRVTAPLRRLSDTSRRLLPKHR